jgi:serine/threonine protein kinase
LVDFGAVRDAAHSQTFDGSTVVGTYGFMAPEQFRGHASERTDLYGVGATCLYLLAQRTPVDLEEKNGAPQLPSVVPKSLVGWIERMIARDPSQRFASAAEARWMLTQTHRLPGRSSSSRAKAIVAILATAVVVPSAIALSLGGRFPSHEILCCRRAWMRASTKRSAEPPAR